MKSLIPGSEADAWLKTRRSMAASSSGTNLKRLNMAHSLEVRERQTMVGIQQSGSKSLKLRLQDPLGKARGF